MHNGQQFVIQVKSDSVRETESNVLVRVDRVIDEKMVRVTRVDNYETLFVSPSELQEVSGKTTQGDCFDQLCIIREIIEDTLSDLEWETSSDVQDALALLRKHFNPSNVQFLSGEELDRIVKEYIDDCDDYGGDDLIAFFYWMTDKWWMGISATAWDHLGEEDRKLLVLHELAHGLAPWKGHGPEWKKMVKLIGGDPKKIRAGDFPALKSILSVKT